MLIPKKLLLVSCCFVACVQASQHDFQSMMACHASLNEPGLAVRIEQSGELIFTDAMGVADIKSREPLKVEHVFQIGSVTKQFTLQAKAQLVLITFLVRMCYHIANTCPCVQAHLVVLNNLFLYETILILCCIHFQSRKPSCCSDF